MEPKNTEPTKIYCNECQNIPLIGVEFINKCNKLSDIIKVHSYCIYNHSKIKDKCEFLLDDIFINYNIKKNHIENKCNNCTKNIFEYLCLECKRNICEECVQFHKGHNVYINKNYLLNEKDIKDIKTNLENSKKVILENISSIQRQIELYKTQLKELESVLDNYKDINIKLISLSNFIINEYEEKYKSRNGILYPIYFNIKNVLNFNHQKLEIKNDKDLPISLYTEELLAKIKMGSYFLIKDSNISKEIADYNNKDIINYNLIDIEKFQEKKLNISKLLFLDKNRIMCINEEKSSLEIYNLLSNKIESSIRLNMIGNSSRIIKKYNTIVVMTDTQIYFLNSKGLSFIQVIKLRDKVIEEINESDNKYTFWKREQNDNDVDIYHKFIYIEYLSEKTLGIIYEGDLRYLDDIDKLNKYIKFKTRNTLECLDFINYKNGVFTSLEDSEDFSFMLLYNKKGNFFELSKIIALAKRIIYVSEVSYISGKHWEYEEKDPYYKFYFDSLNQYSEKKWIISFKCRVKSKRNLYYFYVNDKEFTNETIYYILDIDDYTITRKKLCSSKEDSSLIKKENKFYFFFNESQECSDIMKIALKKYDFIGVKTNVLDFRQIHIENDIVLGWNKSDIYYGKIYHYPNYKLEIIKKISKEYEILSVVPSNNLIIYSNN